MEWIMRCLLGFLTLAGNGCTSAALPSSRDKPAMQETCSGESQPVDMEGVLRSYGVAGIAVDIPHAEVVTQHQRYGGALCFSQALAAALAHMLRDNRDPESPAALLEQYGRELLHREGTRLSLARPGAIAPRGERVKEAWIFVLAVPALSDHVFWLVVERHRNREGGVTAYSYGVN